MAEVKLRLNLDTESVELVVDGQVALESGSDVFSNWVEAYNDKHKPVHVEPVKVETPVEQPPITVQEPVTTEVKAEEVTVQTSSDENLTPSAESATIETQD